VGDAIAAYFDDGGQVVVSLFANGGYAMTGAWTDGGHNVLTPVWVPINTNSFTLSNPAEGLAPNHPVLRGVTAFSGEGWFGENVPTNGAVAIAAYNDGSILAAAGVITDAQGRLRNRVDLNIHPDDIVAGNWTGDALQLVVNALKYH
jgi:hypothetical protein